MATAGRRTGEAQDEAGSVDEDETAKFIALVPAMKPEHQLLALLVACTGMRPAEACSIRSEELISGYRCVTVGAKLDGDDNEGERKIPLPEIVLPYLPAKITGPLFANAPIDDPVKYRRYMVHRSNDMNKYLKDIGIHVPIKKTFYSFRHREISVLDEAECPPRVGLEIVGHGAAWGVHRNFIHNEPAAKKAHWMRYIWKDFDRYLSGGIGASS